jgi:pseudouridine-5'-phosphate glycosidase
MMNSVVYAPDVKDALSRQAPVLALESTIITHGMPWPRNLETALLVEETVRSENATPATMAVLDGCLHVGLTREQLETLAVAKDVAKLSRADLAAAMATGQTGATTVAATMIAARLAGIDVFATGGIGGVHRGAEASFDISADLQELAQTAVTVVAAGAKAILDIPKTLEVLETLGVPVISYRQDAFPAFWSASSDQPAPLRMDDPGSIARAHLQRSDLGIPGGQLVANPIPRSDEIPAEDLNPIIEAAISKADDMGITGKDVTPFLLSEVFDRTKGRSLEANIALVLNNAALASQIAVSLTGLKAETKA